MVGFSKIKHLYKKGGEMKIHFIGIGGEGMCGVAKVALSQGHIVSGSEITPKRWLAELEQLGAKIYPVHDPSNVVGVDLVVRSSGIATTHVEVLAANCFAVPVVKRARALGMILRDMNCQLISVAGSHGKSTTTTMIGRVLEAAGQDPTVVVGAYVPYFGSHARIGLGPVAVVEACEFDRSFLELGAEISVITGIKPDHLDYYQGGLPEIVDAFRQFAELTRQRDGLLVACADDEVLTAQLLPTYDGRVVTYGLDAGNWRAHCLPVRNNTYRFSVYKQGVAFGEFSISVPGSHNVQNALAAIAVADVLGIDANLTRCGLVGYRGIHRRYEKRFVSGSVVVIDDYAHSPHEIEAVFDAVRQEFPKARLICVPCLRQFHRTRQRLSEFARAFSAAHSCVVGPIVAGLGDTEATKDSIISEAVAAAILSAGCRAVGCLDEEEVVMRVMERINDVNSELCVVLTVGSGITENIVTAICERLASTAV